MPISPAVRRFALAHPSIVVVPAEILDEHGLEPEFAELLITEGRLSAGQIDCLERGTALYWQRCLISLRARRSHGFAAPDESFDRFRAARNPSVYGAVHRHVFAVVRIRLGYPSGVCRVCVGTRDRLALLGSVRSALICNLSYWFDRDDASRTAFAGAAARATRPDARCFTALAETFEWIDQLFHIPLREPQQDISEPYLEIVEGAELYAPNRLQPQITALCEQAEAPLRRHASHRAGSRARAFAHRRCSVRLAAAIARLCDRCGARRHEVWSPEMNDPRWMGLAFGQRQRRCGRELARRLAHDR